MARFFGEVGYGDSEEIPQDSGIWVDIITEFPYTGDVIRNTRKLEVGESLNNDITVANSISIVADQYAVDHFFNIKYVRWAGVLWTVTSVEVLSPRLILSLGSVYNGPTPFFPAVPTFDAELGELTIVDTTGVIYTDGDEVIINAAGSPYTIATGESITVNATPDTGYYFATNAEDSWTFTAD